MENYFNYFTEIEEHFQKARGTGLFLLSTLDWALIESWKESGVPLDAVLRGIDRSFEKWQKRNRRGRMVNSLAYCAQEVLAAAQEQAPAREAAPPAAAGPFSPAEFSELASRHSAAVAPRFPEIAASLTDMAEAAQSGIPLDWEQIERRLTVLEDKMFSSLMANTPEERLLETRRDMDRALQPYRSKMSAEQISMLEKQYLRKALLEAAGMPRLSLFHW